MVKSPLGRLPDTTPSEEELGSEVSSPKDGTFLIFVFSFVGIIFVFSPSPLLYYPCL